MSLFIKTVLTHAIVNSKFKLPMIILMETIPLFCDILILAYTGCHRRNGPNFGRAFLMLNYTDITQNTYIQS